MTASENNRSSPRRAFSHEQLVAGVAHGNMPSLADFSRVRCEDVSCGGIAFYLKDEPEFDEYVIGLGKSPNLTYLCARVVHAREAVHKGQMWYYVGCQFTGRARFDRGTLAVVRIPDASVTSDPNTQEEDAQAQPPTSPNEGESHEAGEGDAEVAPEAVR